MRDKKVWFILAAFVAFLIALLVIFACSLLLSADSLLSSNRTLFSLLRDGLAVIVAIGTAVIIRTTVNGISDFKSLDRNIADILYRPGTVRDKRVEFVSGSAPEKSSRMKKREGARFISVEFDTGGEKVEFEVDAETYERCEIGDRWPV